MSIADERIKDQQHQIETLEAKNKQLARDLQEANEKIKEKQKAAEELEELQIKHRQSNIFQVAKKAPTMLSVLTFSPLGRSNLPKRQSLKMNAMEGWLTKLGGFRKNWQRRWMI